MDNRIRVADWAVYLLSAILIGTWVDRDFFNDSPFMAIWTVGGIPWIIVLIIRRLDAWDLKQGPSRY